VTAARSRPDPGTVYAAVRARFAATVESCRADELATIVPATPDWSVRDVLAHVVGLAADLNAARFPAGGDGEAWTAAQVTARRKAALGDVLAEWEREGPAFEDGLRLFGYELGAHFVADLVVHLHDVEEALARPPLADDEVLVVALDHYCGFLDDAMQLAGSVVLRTVVEEWQLGDGPVVAELTCPAYDLLRTVAARRSRQLVSELPWAGDVRAFLDAFESALPGSYSLPDESCS